MADAVPVGEVEPTGERAVLPGRLDRALLMERAGMQHRAQRGGTRTQNGGRIAAGGKYGLGRHRSHG